MPINDQLMFGTNAGSAMDERVIRFRPITNLFVVFEKVKLDITASCGVCSEAKFVEWMRDKSATKFSNLQVSQCKILYKMLGKFSIGNLEKRDDFALMRLTKHPEIDRTESLVDCPNMQTYLASTDL